MPPLLRRPWWPIAVGVCFGVLVQVVGVKRYTPPVFEARAAVTLNTSELPSDLLRHSMSGESEPDLPRVTAALLSDALLHEIIVRAFPGTWSPKAEQRIADGIRSRLNLTYRRQTQTIGLHYHDRSPVRAAEVVNLFTRFFGEENIVPVAALPVVQVSPSHKVYLVLGGLGGLLGGLLVLLGRLGRVAVERFAGGH